MSRVVNFRNDKLEITIINELAIENLAWLHSKHRPFDVQ